MNRAESRGLVGEAVLLAAGAADAAASGLGGILAQGRALLARGAVAGLAGEAHEELRARGTVVLDRFAVQPAYLESLARHVAARDNRADG